MRRLHAFGLCLLTLGAIIILHPLFHHNTLDLQAQITPPAGVTFVTVDPGGACSVPQPLQFNTSNGKLWGCDGVWVQIAGSGSGGNTLTSPNSTITIGGSSSASTIDVAAKEQTRTCMIIVGADNGTALANGDLGPQLSQCQVNQAVTVYEIDVMADGGTPNVIVQRSHLGTPTALLSGALATASAGAVACSNTGGTTGIDGTTTCSGTLQNTSVAKGDWIGLTSGTAGGTAKRMSIAVHYTL